MSFITKVVDNNTATLVIDPSTASSQNYVLKRRPAVYASQIYTAKSNIFIISVGDVLNNKFSVRIKDLDISDGSVNYTYQIVRDSVTTSQNGSDIRVTANSLNGNPFIFKVQKSDGDVYSDMTNITAELSYQSVDNKITIPESHSVNGEFSVIVRNLPIAPNSTSPDYRYRIADASGNPIAADIVTTETYNGQKDIVITKNSSDGNFVFQLQRSSDGTNYSPVGCTAYIQYNDVDGVFTVPTDYINDNFSFNLKNISDNVQIVSLSAVDMKTDNAGENKKNITVTADSNGSAFKFKVQRSANGKDFTDITSIVTVERYFDDEMPYICTEDEDGFYIVPKAYKFGNDYSLKIKDFTDDFKLVDNSGNEISYKKQISGNDTIFTVSGVSDDLKFKIQTLADDETTYEDVSDAVVGVYSEEVVKTDKNGTSLRFEYFPSDATNTPVTKDHYGNPIGYEDIENIYTGSSASVPYGTAFDNKLSVLVKELDKLPEGQSYGVDDSSATVKERESGNGKVDLLVTRPAEGAPSSFAITGGSISGDVTAVRFFVADENDENGVVKLPANVAKSLSEHLDYGVSSGADEYKNGLWEKYYYTVVECNEDGKDAFSSLSYNQTSDTSSSDIYTAKKLEFDINTRVYHQNENDIRKYINIKIVDNSNNIVKKDINGNALKLTMTINGQEQEFFASDQPGNIPEEGVIVIPNPVDCASVHCVVDNLPYGIRNSTNNGWTTEYDYDVKRCKATGKDGNYTEFSVTKSVYDSQPQKEKVKFKYDKSWDESAQIYGLQPESAHFALFRTLDGVNSDYVKTINQKSGEETNLDAGTWVQVDGIIGDVWKPYSYYLKEYNSEYDNAHPENSKEISANNMYSNEYIYETDKPFVLKGYTYAELDQGIKNKLRKTKHELIKSWEDEEKFNRPENYTIKLQTKTGADTEWSDVDLSKIIVASVDVKSDGTKLFTKQTVSSGQKELSIPQRSLHYSFDQLPLFDSRGLEYSYRVVETKIGTDGVEEKQTYLFLVPGTESTDEEFSYCRSIRRGTKTYYVDYSEYEDYEYVGEDDLIHTGKGTGKEAVEHYSKSVITNKMVTNIVSFTNFKAKKVWNDNKNVYGLRPKTITYILKRTETLNGETTEDENFALKKTVGEVDNWECEWRQCAAFAANGGEFNYYVVEDTVDYYTTTTSASNEEQGTQVYTFTNTYKPQMKKFTAYKNWDDISNQFNLRPNEIKYELWCKYAVYELSVVKDENNKIVSAEPRFVKTVDIPVYDTTKSQDKDQSHVYRFMKSQDNTLNGSTYFKKTLTSTYNDGDNTNRWKVEFDNLPDYINTCIFDENNTDGKYVGKASQVTYYIKETVDDKTKQIYECADSDDSMKSAEKKLQLYGQNDISSKVNAGTTNGNIEVPKTYSSNGLLAVLISDLPANDIYDKKYTYSVKEVLANGTESNSTGLKCEESGFHDNSNGKTSLIISKELPKVCFKIQRKISGNTTKETVVKGSDKKRLSVTINGVVYTADSNGVICVPKVYTGTTSESKIVNVTINNLPANDESNHAYTYSVVECNELGTAETVETADKMTASLAGTALTVTKPLGTESQNVTFKLYRTPTGGSDELLTNITYEKVLSAEVGIHSIEADSTGMIKVSKSYAVNSVLTAKIKDLPETGHTISDYTIQECDESGNVMGTPTIVSNTSDNVITVTKNYPKLYFKVFRHVEDGDEELVKTIGEDHVKAFCRGEKSEADENGVMSFSHLLANEQTLTINIPNLPEKNNDDQDYIYVVKECDAEGTVLNGSYLTIETPSESGYLTVTKNSIPECKDMYFKIMRDSSAVTKIVTGTKELTASKFTISKTELEGDFLKATGDNDVSVTNTLETIDVVVAKSWDDNGYGVVESGTAKVSETSEKLHYNVKVTLSGDNITIPNTYTNEKIIGIKDKDSNFVDGNGVRFESLPKYVDENTLAVYKVKEDATDDNASYGQISNAYHKDKGTEITSSTTPKFTVGSKRYGYVGSCKWEDTNSNGIMQFNILNTLPLTAVKVQKHWDDQNNQFGLRQSDINDKNKGENTNDRINLTLSKKANPGDYENLKPTKITGQNGHEAEFKDWYKSESNIPLSGNEWTYTYKKLLKYDINNNAYTFQITEDQVPAYKEPHYCAVSDYNDDSKKTEKQKVTSVEINNSESNVAAEQLAWDGTHPLVETFEITNKLDTINVRVAKKWEDNGYENGNNLHYNVKVTLSSTDITMLAGGNYSENKVIANTDKNGVEFANVPRYKKDGTTSVVYKVTEYATNDTATVENQPIGERGQISNAYNDAGTATTDKFTVGSKRYGYVGSCKLETDTNGNMQFNILNTLPLTAVKVEKEWDDQSNKFNLRPEDIADKLSIYHSATSSTSDLDSSALGSQIWGAALSATNKDYVTAATFPSKNSNKWTYTYTKLLKYDINNNPYLFKVTETKVNAYKDPVYPTQYLNYSDIAPADTSTNGATALTKPLEVKNTLDTKKVTVYKNWVDKNYSDTNTLHYDITVGLAASYGKYVENAQHELVIQSSNYSNSDTITAGAESCEFVNLPVYDANGTAISYSATETGQQYGYESSISGGVTLTGGDGSITITNTLPLVSFTAQKEWDDEYNRDKVRPTSVTFKLQRKISTETSWTDVASLNATQDNNWKVDFGKQRKYDAQNNEYSYQIVEVTPAQYSSSYVKGNPTARTDDSSIMNTDYTFTNKYDITEKQLTVKKIWNDVGYEDTIRPTDLSKIKVELWCRYMNSDGTSFTDRKVSDDTTEVIGIKTHIDKILNQHETYECNPGLNEFTVVSDNDSTADDNESLYESTYTFTHLPVYINVDGTATKPGTPEKWQAVTYYVKETFEVNGHVYKSEYSADNTNYYGTASGYTGDGKTITGTNLLTTPSNINSNPADKTIYVKNTPVTRDFLVTKEWDDNGYGVTEGNGKVSDLSKKLHYTTAVTLKGTTTFDNGTTQTTVYNDNTKYIAAEAFAANTPQGVVFKNVPIYDKNGNVIVYKVTESKITHAASTGEDNIADVGSWNGYATSNAGETEFEQLKADKSQRDYGYEGSAVKYTKTDSGRTYTSRYHITDVLPLTAVQVKKHWLDQNNEFDLRPTNIKDVNKGETVTDSIDLTISRKLSTADDSTYTDIHPTNTDTYKEDWYKSGTKDTTTTANEWTYTYNKLLKYDVDNTSYNFKIIEEPVKAYEACQYRIADDYGKTSGYTDKQYVTSIDTLSNNSSSWNGETILEQHFDITNKLDTRSIKVYKYWVDNGNTATHYDIDITLSSNATNNGTRKDNENKYKETQTLSKGTNYIEFKNLPKYDTSGNVIVYNVREDATQANVPKATDRTHVDITKKSDLTVTLIGTLPTFTDGDRHYGYVGSAEYVAEESGNEKYAIEYHITNTLPKTTVKAKKVWECDENMYDDKLNKYRNSSVEFNLMRKSGNEYINFNDTTTQGASHLGPVSYSGDMYMEYSNLPVYDYANVAYVYKVVETPLKGYRTTSYSPETVTAVKDSTEEITVTNTQITGDAEFIKIDKNHYDAYKSHGANYVDVVLEGAKFHLFYKPTAESEKMAVKVKKNENGEYVLDNSGSNEVESGSNGKIKFKDLPLNTYYLDEFEVPNGYLSDDDKLAHVEFTVDVNDANSTTGDKVTYDKGFIENGKENENRIGNLQRVEEVEVTLVKSDKENGKRLANATYYLLVMNPFIDNNVADKALEECNGVLTADVLQYWQTANTINPDLTSYIYTTDINGEIEPIKNIQNGRYAFVEVQAPEGYERSFCEPFNVTSKDKVHRIEHEDPRKSAKLKILKEDKYHNGLEGGIFELWYQPDVQKAPPTYAINTPVTSPIPSQTIDSTNTKPAIPNAEQDTVQHHTVTYSYSETGTVPTAESENWVLPRTDNDYIFFEDVIYSNWFWKQGTKIVESYKSDNRWLTIGELDNEANTDIVAIFYSDINGTNQIGKYKVWERFVYYTDSGVTYNASNSQSPSTGRTQNIIWKIQPPDGAKSVRFILGWNGLSNSTKVFEFTKGNLYRRNNNGSQQSVTNAGVWDNLGAKSSEVGNNDDRTAGNSGVAYKALPQKIIFRRNHYYCWDNIHIEFFKQTGTDTYEPVGERFPGYMMEPYAYAKADYRIEFDDRTENAGDLCYEIAIPKGATHFRINNGTTSTHSSNTGSDYYEGYGYYYTAITPIDFTSTDKKNYNNYWKFESNSQSIKKGGTLTRWTENEITKGNGTIHDTVYDNNATAFDVESDHDFIYFTKPSSWDNVYAYFYGGGDLRQDNWQRAIWSIWPGVLPFNSELQYDPTDINGSNVFNKNINTVQLLPGAKFKNKYNETVYRFKRPLGDNRNYTKVIFSNGLVGAGTAIGNLNGKETNVITYTLGKGYYAYNENASKTGVGEWTQEQSNSTIPYTFRTSGGTVDYIYIKNNATNSWDDIHIKFYNGSTQILQQNTGYVMKYTGKLNGEDTEWYKVPVPQNATSFSLNNGNDKSSSTVNNSKSTAKYPILEYSANPTTSGYTKTGSMVYQIADTPTSDTTYALTLCSPTMTRTETESIESHEQVNDADYISRGDKLNIVDMNNVWSLSNKPQIRFYDENGTQIGNKAYSGIMSKAENSGTYNGKHWWSLDIPSAATSFTINGDGHYQIYPKTISNSGAEDTTFTTGGMYYKTTGANTAEIIWPTFTNGVSSGSGTGNYDERGDYLYLVCGQSNNWSDMYVTFYSDEKGENVISNADNIQMKYTGSLSKATDGTIPEDGKTTVIPEAVGHWYKAAIPYSAKSFKVYDATSSPTKQLDKAYPIYTKRTKISPYKDDYTLGGMQYRISDSASAGVYTLGLASAYNDGKPFYPNFTENEVIEWPEGDSVPTSSEITTIDPTVVGEYKSASVVPIPQSTASEPDDMPVLYNTGDVSNNQTVTYNWTESNYYEYLRFVPDDWWNTNTISEPDNANLSAHFFTVDTPYTIWPGVAMFDTGETYGNTTRHIWAVKIPSGNYGSVVFNVYGGSVDVNKTVDINFPSARPNGNGLLYVMDTIKNGQKQTATLDNNAIASVLTSAQADNKIRFKNNENWPTPIYASFNGGSSAQMDKEADNVWSIDIPSGASTVVFSSGTNSTGSITLDSSNHNGQNMICKWTATTQQSQTLLDTNGKVYFSGKKDVANATKAIFYKDTTSDNGDNWTYMEEHWNNEGNGNSGDAGFSSPDSVNVYWFKIPDNATGVEFIFTTDMTNAPTQNYTRKMRLSEIANGNYAYVDKDAVMGTHYSKSNRYQVTFKEKYVDGTTTTYSWKLSDYTPPVSTSFSATYQPEDRYGYIENVANANDKIDSTNGASYNFIHINTSIANPYIKFYTTTDGTGNVIGGVESGINLKDAKLNGSSTVGTKIGENKYSIRLPKNAKSFAVGDGTNYSNATVLDDSKEYTYTVTKDGSAVTISDTTDRIGLHNGADISILEPTTDFDYIYFTDKDSWNSNGSKTIYAYYYGGIDGEYNTWPGVPAQKVYTDNSGKSVYVFQPPKQGSDSKVYPYVIFNNGSASDRKITQKIGYQMGYNYTPNDTTANYGTKSAYATSGVYKAQGEPDDNDANRETQTKTITLSDKYIFFVNNGTKDLRAGATGRYKLDDVHIRFFDENNNSIGNTAGYKMYELMAEYEGDEVYRVRIPDSAKKFQITNGIGKNAANSTYNNYRYSEVKDIKENGLYRFVRSAESVDKYWDSTDVPSDIAQLNAHNYYLELLNEEKESDDELIVIGGSDEPVYLATVETGYDGLTKWITALRTKTVAGKEVVDDEYLKNTLADIKNTSVTEVKVKKWGKYFWKEIEAPYGYEIDVETLPTFKVGAEESELAAYVQSATDSPKTGAVQLTKTAKEKVGNTDIGDALDGFKFRLYDNSDIRKEIKLVRKAGLQEYYVYPDNPTQKQQEILSKMLSERVDSENDTSDYVWEHNSDGTDFEYYNTGNDSNSPETDEHGQIKIENIPWGTYYLEEVAVKENSGYVYTNSNADKSDNRNKVYFTVGRNNCLDVQELSCTDEMQPAYIRLFEHINMKKEAWGDPTFIFKIKQTANYINGALTDTDGKEMLVALTVNEDNEVITQIVEKYDSNGEIKFTADPLGIDYANWLVEGTTESEYKGMYHIDDEGRIRVEPGKYEITRMPVSRYEFVADTWKLEDDNTSNIYETHKHTEQNPTMTGKEPKVEVTIPASKTAMVHYYDKVAYYDKFSEVQENINTFYSLDNDNKHETIKGIRIAEYHVDKTKDDISGDDTLTVSLTDNTRFKAYMVLADGSERAMTDDEIKKLGISYTYKTHDDKNFGSYTDKTKNDFSYDNANDKIKVNNSSRYNDEIYTLTAKYNSYETDFELIMAESDKPKTLYTRQVVFKSDIVNGVDTPNVSYFVDSIIHDSVEENPEEINTGEYEFTFIILDDETKETGDTDKITVYDVRHNGRSIGKSNEWETIVNKLINVSDGNSAFEINESFRQGSGLSITYSFASWLNTSGENLTASYDDIKENIMSDLNDTSPIVFTAQLS